MAAALLEAVVETAAVEAGGATLSSAEAKAEAVWIALPPESLVHCLLHLHKQKFGPRPCRGLPNDPATLPSRNFPCLPHNILSTDQGTVARST